MGDDQEMYYRPTMAPPSDIPASLRLATAARGQIKAQRRGRRATGRVSVAVDHEWLDWYLRISRDAEERGLGVERQRGDGYSMADRLGIPRDRVRFHCDNDLSGADFTARDAYDQLLEGIEAGEVTLIGASETARLAREPLEKEELILIMESYGVGMRTSDGDDHTPGAEDMPDKLAMSRVKGAFDTLEVMKIRRRTRKKHLELALAGKVSGGGPRPFGFEDDRITIRESEAALIREAVGRVLAEEPLLSIVRDWYERGITAPGVKRYSRDDRNKKVRDEHGNVVPSVLMPGKPWEASSLRRMIMRGRNCGWRDYGLAENGLYGEMFSEAEWDAIVAKEKIERVRALLTDPTRRTNTRQRKYLLTGGMARCGECKTAMIARTNNKLPCYRCSKEPRHGGCGRCYLKAESLEEEVVKRLFAALCDPAMISAWAEAESLETTDYSAVIAAIKADDRVLDTLADQLGNGLDAKRYQRQAAKVQARIDANQKLLASAPSAAAVIAEHGGVDRLIEKWPTMNTGQQRAILNRVIDRVEVKRGTKGRNWFDPERVRVVWLGAPADA